MKTFPDIDTARQPAWAPSEERSSGGPGAVSGVERALDACADGATLLTVNRRLARELVSRHERRQFERGATWWDTPRILPLPGWLEQLHDEALTLGLSDRTRLPPLVAERRWHTLIGRDRALTLLSPLAAARQAMRAWQLGHAWHCLPEEEDYLPIDQYHWRRWAADYAATLEAERRVDAGTLAAHVTALIGRGGLPLPERIVLAGFLSPTPATQALLDALVAAGVALERLADDPPCTPRAVLWPDDATELAGIADAVRRRLERDPEAVLGVVIPDIDARRGEVLRAFDRRFFPAMTPAEIERTGRPYDLSIGQPLADTAAVRAALGMLQLALGALELRDLSTLLLSPYLGAHDDERRGRERLDRHLRVDRVQRLDLDGLIEGLGRRSALRGPLSRLAREARGWRRSRRAGAADWAGRFALCLDAFGWPGGELDSEEFQAVRAWRGVLDDLVVLDDGGSLGAGEALGLVRHLAAERVFQAETPDLPVRVLGRLESHGQRFDALWVAGLDTERWPPAGSPSPFLPMARQKEAGMPEASGAARLALAQAEFAHWCASAPVVVASRAAEREGKPLDSASVLGPLEPGVLDAPVPAAMVAGAATLESIDDAIGPALERDEAVAGGAGLFEDQAACPFRAFAAHRLRVRPLEEVGGGVDSRQAGTVLHRALELAWRRLRTHAALLEAIGAGALDEIVAQAVDAALEHEGVAPVWRGLERRRLVPLLRDWMEAHEAPRAPFEVVAFESRRETMCGGVRVSLAIDRMDRVVAPGEPLQGMTDEEAGEGALAGPRVVLDYKSGTNNGTGTWEEQRIRNPQLPLYALTDERVAGVGFAQVAVGDSRFKGLVADEELLPLSGRDRAGRETWEA